MEQLKVPIGADVSNLKSGLKSAETALKQFSDKSKNITEQLKRNSIESANLGASISKLNAEYKSGAISQNDFGRGMLSLTSREKTLANESKSLHSDLIKLKQSTKDLGSGSTLAAKGIKNLQGQTINGNSAMTAFSRTIQDAPFGIMGVSNNITNLTEQFGYLKNKTGSAKGALQAMLRDMKGFGGITLAISVATSLMLVFGDKLFKTRDKAKELRDEQEKLTASLEDYVTALDDVSRASLKGEKSALKETTTLMLLKEAAQNTTLKMSERIKAVDQLQKLYPDYLGNISKEKILNGQVATTFETLTESILKRARATAALNIIIKNSELLLTLESQASEKKAAIDKKGIQLQNANANALGRAGKEREGLNFSVLRANKLQGEYNKLVKDANVLEGKIQGIELNNIDLEKAIQNQGGITTTLPVDVIVTPKGKKTKIQPFDIAPLNTTSYDEQIALWKKSVTLSVTTLGIQGGVNWAGLFKGEQLAKQIKETQEKLEAFNAGAMQLISGSMTNTFGEIGSVIGTAFAQGSDALAGVGKTLLKGLGGLISSMGDYLIQAGTAAVLAGVLLKLFGSIAGIGAGFAAIAGGIVLKGVGTAMSGFAGAGDNSSSNASSTGSNYSSPQSNGGFSGGENGGGTYIFEIAGTKLVGVLANTLNRNKSLGGTLSLT